MIVGQGALDFGLEVAAGRVVGHELLTVMGRNPSQTSASGFVEISEFGNLTYLDSAETMNIVSSSVNDTSAGTGMQTVICMGVDGTGAAVSELVTMNGTSNVLTTQAFLRVNFLQAVTVGVGSGGWNDGAVTATADSAGTLQCQMRANSSRSTSSHYTVPLGRRLFVKQVEFNISRQSGGQEPVVEFCSLVRLSPTSPWTLAFDKIIDAAVVSDVPLLLPEYDGRSGPRTDIRFMANTSENSTEVRSQMYGILGPE